MEANKNPVQDNWSPTGIGRMCFLEEAVANAVIGGRPIGLIVMVDPAKKGVLKWPLDQMRASMYFAKCHMVEGSRCRCPGMNGDSQDDDSEGEEEEEEEEEGSPAVAIPSK